ncbi:chemotaxis response regulator protein-glutamate methylesterase [Paraferrimonas sp. SM1919]|uniref:protein-glutamate methylesterase/protein-glutamine glutaminase n=1 Tax=Paraferrimonas sp. SM1919 TaxID=2662263 RepID=UPI0013D3146E|nr:chemotaxis response regulator protein-glutamate methylesterase [Paraferrimonas sp. SM1919]
MKVKVLVVDDSSFFRRRLTEILNQDPLIEVVATAEDGLQALAMVKQYQPDVVTMDIEMPKLNGIDAVRHIRQDSNVPVLMFSSLTHEGAKATIEALEAGASDFLPKRFEDIALDKHTAIKTLLDRVKGLATAAISARSRKVVGNSMMAGALKPESVVTKVNKSKQSRPKVLLIGSSTGGPVALQKVLTQLPQDFPAPILLIQHMPSAFTPTFAERLNGLCKVNVVHAENGMKLEPGVAYLAPGGMQMLLQQRADEVYLKIIESAQDISYKPSVDITFGSASRVYQQDALALVLTGMGADGCEGARLLQQAGADIWAQDEQSCVVYGMPRAVVKAGLVDKVFAIDDFSHSLLKEFQCQ